MTSLDPGQHSTYALSNDVAAYGNRLVNTMSSRIVNTAASVVGSVSWVCRLCNAAVVDE